jgi:hypothetical protein
MTPAIPVKTTPDIKIASPSETLQNLNPWFRRIRATRKITARKTKSKDFSKKSYL